ncbi:MAG: DUF58 domain-containing protein [Bacteroides sp.]
MTKRFVLYMVIMAGTIYLSLLYDGSVIRFLIAFELILPAILLVLLIMQKKYVEVTLKIPSNVVGKNDNIIVESSVVHRLLPMQLLMPIHRISIKGKCVRTDNSVTPIALYFEEQDKERQSQSLVLSDMTEHYGVIDFVVNKVRIHDYMSIFALTIPFNYLKEVYVFPENDTVSINLRSLRANKDIKIEDVCVNSLGRSPENVNDPREYRPGDPIKRIHWKISARIDKLMVKEYAGLVSSKILLLINGMNNEDRDKWIEQVFLISSALKGSLPMHDIGWMHDGRYIKYTVEGERDFVLAMQAFLRAQQQCEIESCKSGKNKAYLLNGFFDRDYTTVLDFDPKGIIRVNGEELTGLYE